jgi:hypothetical protein
LLSEKIGATNEDPDVRLASSISNAHGGRTVIRTLQEI